MSRLFARILCLLGCHTLTNVYGPDDRIYTCLDCGKRKWRNW